MRQVPEPEDEWVARMRERARLDAEALVPRPPFPVFGLAEPALRPMALAEAVQVNGQWETITLAYGEWSVQAGPYIAVSSSAGPDEARDGGTEAELARVIEDERNRIADHAGVDEEEPPGPPAYAHEPLLLGDLEVSALVGRHGSVWAAYLPADGVSVRVTGRGVAPGAMRLGPVADLEPYLRGRNEVLGRLAEQHRQRPPPVLEPAEGVAAYRALAEATLESHARDAAALRAGRVPRHPAGEGAIMGALWQRAVSEQARISGVDARRADEIVPGWSTTSRTSRSRHRGSPPNPGCGKPRSMRRCGTASWVRTSRATRRSEPGPATGPIRAPSGRTSPARPCEPS